MPASERQARAPVAQSRGGPNKEAVEGALHQMRLWYSDPTGEEAVRNLLHMTRSAELKIVDERGDLVFLISREVLAEALNLFTFTKSRRGQSIRAHSKKKALTYGAATPGEGRKPNS